MFVTTAPLTAPVPLPATLAGTVLLAVKAEVATPAAATATPASRTRDLRIAGSCSLRWLSAARSDHPVQRRLRHFVDAISSAGGAAVSTPVPKETGVAKATLGGRSPCRAKAQVRASPSRLRQGGGTAGRRRSAPRRSPRRCALMGRYPSAETCPSLSTDRLWMRVGAARRTAVHPSGRCPPGNPGRSHGGRRRQESPAHGAEGRLVEPLGTRRPTRPRAPRLAPCRFDHGPLG